MEGVRSQLNFNNCLVIPVVDCVGGVALLWNDEVKLSIQTYTTHHIDVTILSDDYDA